MTTTNEENPTMTTLAQLDEAARKARERADKERAKAQELAQARDQAAADLAARKVAATDEFWTQRRNDYRANFGGLIDAAWTAFIDAVRVGGDTVAAWKQYRTTRRIVADEYYALEIQRLDKLDAAILARREEHTWINHEGGMLDTWRREDRGSEYRERLAAWNKRVAAATGQTRTPHAAPHAVAFPYESLSTERVTGRVSGGPRPLVDEETYAKALDQAVRTIEEESLEQAQLERTRALRAHVEQATQ